MFLKKLFATKNKREPLVDVPVEAKKQYTLTLFLDFDGVLHSGLTEKYHHLPNLFKVLDLFPCMDVVISSDVRIWTDFKDIEKIFGTYGHRVTGVTPTGAKYYNRQAEINHYITEHNITDYIAIDDDYSNALFNPNCDWLFKTNILKGLDDDTTAEFIEFINKRLKS